MGLTGLTVVLLGTSFTPHRFPRGRNACMARSATEGRGRQSLQHRPAQLSGPGGTAAHSSGGGRNHQWRAGWVGNGKKKAATRAQSHAVSFATCRTSNKVKKKRQTPQDANPYACTFHPVFHVGDAHRVGRSFFFLSENCGVKSC